MKRPTKRSLVLLLTLALLALSSVVPARNGTSASMLAEPLALSVEAGQELIVDVLVVDALVVYGIDIRLSFDPDILEAINADGSGGIVRLEHGSFIDPAQSHILQNWASNVAGTVDYASALLNPAPPVAGDGFLARATFRAKVTGQTIISIEDGLFGTQAGGTIPAIPHLVLVSPPIVYAGDDQIADEGDTVFVNASFSDPNPDDSHVATIAWGDGDVTPGTVGDGAVTGNHVYVDEGIYVVSVEVCDSTGCCGSDTLTVTVANAAPIVGEITAPMEPLLIDSQVQASASFADPGVLDTHTATWDWGDDTTSAGLVEEANGSGTVSGDHVYTTPGVHIIKLTVTDNDGGVGVSEFRYIVIYDPEGGFVTGGGWIQSPEGAYPDDPTLEGKANFGFVSKYKKNATIPTGQTQFHFKAGDFKFDAESYEWLVIFGARAWFQGIGTVNGESGYRFLVTAVDGDIDPNDAIEEDRFRIKVWDEDANGVESIVYDNSFGSPDFGEDWATELGGGSIVIHHGS